MYQDLSLEQYPNHDCDYSDELCLFFSPSAFDTPLSPDGSGYEFRDFQEFSLDSAPGTNTFPSELEPLQDSEPETEPYLTMSPNLPGAQVQYSIHQVQWQHLSNNQLEMKLLLSFPQSPSLPLLHIPNIPESLVPQTTFTRINLDSTNPEAVPYFVTQMQSLPIDVSGNLSDFHYSKIFHKYRNELLLNSHPVMSENDLELIRTHGRLYFLRNVKMIAPKIGPWKFNSHISRGLGTDRQFNIPGAAVTCRVKEWLIDDGLWRLYHYKQGKFKGKK